MKKRIIISVSSDLCTDQRVLKVSKTCYENGFDVLLVGRKLKYSLPLETPFPHKRWRLFFNSSFAFYAELNIRLFFFLLFCKADILLSNDTDTLAANFLASKLRKKKLVFDAHELFPEVPELTNRPNVKRVWTKIEDLFFPHLQHSYTVCNSIAAYYNHKYNINMKVVRNVPYYCPAPTQQKQSQNIKTILYQGAVNTGRGLEWVIDAMPYVKDAQLLIIGSGDIKPQLEEKVRAMQLTDKIRFKDKMKPEALLSYTRQADLGLCLLENKGLSYYYALPNRIFDYINAGIPVLATRFPEIEAIVDTYQTGALIDNYEPEYLAQTINEMMEHPYSTEHFQSLASKFCWENEEKILLDIIRDSK